MFWTKKYCVTVENCNSIFDSWGLYWRYGVKKKRDRTYEGYVSKRRYPSFQVYCRSRHMRYHIKDDFGKRSGDYRKRFFNSYPAAFGNFYFCAYCGFPVHRDKVTIDHLIPVGRVNKDPVLQKKLKRRGYSDVNDPKNLVAACARCNQRKGTKVKGWVMRGRIGRINVLWYMRHAIRIAVTGIVIWYLMPFVLSVVQGVLLALR